MPRSRMALPGLLLFCFCLVTPIIAQNSSSTSSQATATLQSALAALAGNSTVSDVTLAGSVEWIAGSDDENGTTTYKAVLGANRLDMAFSGGTRSEVRSTSSSGPSGTWIGLDGISHAMSSHNVMTDPGWFPLFTLATINSSTSTFVTYVGQETRNGLSVIHLTAPQQPPSSAGNGAALLQHLSQVDIFLDSHTLLPVSYVFNSHPDNNALLDIPTEIRYSDYQRIGGTQIPLHVQKFVNNSLILDIEFQNASVNKGLTAAQISGQ